MFADLMVRNENFDFGKGQKYRIMKYMLSHGGEIEVWRLVAPRPSGGLGIAQYSARIKELRDVLESLGYDIKNVAGRKFFLEKIEQQRTLV